MLRFYIYTLLLAFAISASSCCDLGKPEDDPIAAQNERLQLNQIQVIASHNSYRKRTTDTVFKLLDTLYKGGFITGGDLNPRGLDYDHLDFTAQLSNYGVRGLEIDIYNDPQGGLFATRRINDYVGLPEASGVTDLDAPGFKVLHIKDVDYNTHYYTFKQALQAIKNWSDANPAHLPLFINIETKKDGPADNATLASLGFLPALPFDAAAADAIDVEIKSVFGASLDKILTPDKIRGSLSTLNAVVTQKKWPKLGEARGKIIFIMEGNAVADYVAGHASLQGRAAFVYANAGAPEAAFLLLNSAVADKMTITQRVNEGYIVRTRADSDTNEARSGDYAPMKAAFESGAQITSTDYYRPDPRGLPVWTTYVVKFPNAALARKNVVNATNVAVQAELR